MTIVPISICVRIFEPKIGEYEVRLNDILAEKIGCKGGQGEAEGNHQKKATSSIPTIHFKILRRQYLTVVFQIIQVRIDQRKLF